MDLVHRFSVQAPIEEAWYALNHIDRLAPCFPGASIEEFTGNEFTGSVKIKFGPTLDYKGSGTFLERDDAEHKAVVEARGSDLRGGSGVLAKVYVEMWENGRLTDVVINTDLGISGRPAQLGRGVIEDVSNKLMLAFVDRLQDRFDAGIGRPDYVAPVAAPLPTAAAEPGAAPRRAQDAGVAAGGPGASSAVGSNGAGGAGSAGAVRGVGGSGSGSGAVAGTGPVRSAPPTAPQYGTEFPQDEPALNVITTVLPSVLKRYGVFVLAGTVLLWIVARIAGKIKRRK